MKRQEIDQVLGSAGLRPRHHLGQNFMVDTAVLGAIADAGEIVPEDVILEVGPGVGNLTRLLAERATQGEIVAVDIDATLLPAARRHHAALPNVTWLIADVLAGKHAVEPSVLDALRAARRRHPAPHGNFKLVANLPYNAASPLIAELLVTMWHELQTTLHAGEPLLFERLVFTVQYEVALRMTAAPDSRDYGPLGILIQALADAEILRKIAPGSFWPPPKIHSALVRVRPSLEKMRRVPDVLRLQSMLAGLFAHRRQTLSNAFKHSLHDAYTEALKARLAGRFDLSRRPETFAISDFLELAQMLRAPNDGPPASSPETPDV